MLLSPVKISVSFSLFICLFASSFEAIFLFIYVSFFFAIITFQFLFSQLNFPYQEPIGNRLLPNFFFKFMLQIGRDPFNQNFRKFRSKTQWIGSVQPEKFRKNWSTF